MKSNRILIGAACLVLATPAGANLLVNGDFETGNDSFATDYVYSPGNIFGAQTYDVVANPSSVHGQAYSYTDHTSGGGLMMAVNGSTNDTAVVWGQTVTDAPATGYRFSLYTSTWYSHAAIQLRINGVDTGPEFLTPDVLGEWVLTVIEWQSGPATSATLELVNTSTAFGGNDFALDDLAFVAIADTDGDGVPNASDSCIDVFNPDQVDADGDGFGNACDADVNNDCIVNVIDLGALKAGVAGGPVHVFRAVRRAPVPRAARYAALGLRTG